MKKKIRIVHYKFVKLFSFEKGVEKFREFRSRRDDEALGVPNMSSDINQPHGGEGDGNNSGRTDGRTQPDAGESKILPGRYVYVCVTGKYWENYRACSFLWTLILGMGASLERGIFVQVV